MTLLPAFQNDEGAMFSADRVYRFRLWRRWGPRRPACFCMLNPSTGNENELDPTLRRCVRFAKDWGCGGIEVVNLFALVTPDPSDLLVHKDAVGIGNDEAIREVAVRSRMVTVGWGAFPQAKHRSREVAWMISNMGIQLECLGVNADGSPRHPLYLPATTARGPWMIR